MVIQVVDSQPITTGELGSQMEDQESTNKQSSPRKMTSVIATFSKATKKSQNDGGECRTIKTENPKIETEGAMENEKEDECSELMEKMTQLKVNDDKNDQSIASSPKVSKKKMVSVIRTRAKPKAKKSDEDDSEEEEGDNDKKCTDEVLNERGPMKSGHKQKKFLPYDASPMSDSSYSSQDSPPYQPQYVNVYISDNSCSSSGSSLSPPPQPQVVKCMSQVLGSGGTYSVYNVEGQAADSNEPKASPPQKSLHLGSGGIVKFGVNSNNSTSVLTLTAISASNSRTRTEPNIPPLYPWSPSATNSNCEQGLFNTFSTSPQLRDISNVEALSPQSNGYCLSPYSSSQESFSPASSTSVMSPNTFNTFANLDLENDSNFILTTNDFTDSVDELIASFQPESFPDIDSELLGSIDLDPADSFDEINTNLDEDWNEINNYSTIASNLNSFPNSLINVSELNQTMPSLRDFGQTSNNQPRSRSNSGRSEIEQRQYKITTRYRKILPKMSDSNTTALTFTNKIPTSTNNLSTECKSARDRLKDRLNNEKMSQTLLDVDLKDLRFYQDGDREGDTNLHIILGNKSRFSDEVVVAVVEKFVSCKETLDIPNFKGQTPLFCAVIRNDPLIVEYLIECGADPGYPCKDGITPMHCVAKLGDAYVEVARVLCSKCKPQQLNKKNRDGLTPLHYSVKYCQTKCVGVIDALLSNGAGVAGVEAQASKDGKSALHMAVEKASLEMVSAICSSYKNISNVIDHHMFNRETALHLAARLNSACNEDVQTSIIKVLIKHGAKSVKNKEGKFPKQLVSDQRLQIKNVLSFKSNIIDNL